MVRIPASCVTSSGGPHTSVTSRRGRSAVASTATEPAMTLTRSATTPSKSRVVGESRVQRDITRLPSPHAPGAGRPVARTARNIRYIAFAESQHLPRSCDPLLVADRGQPAGQPVDCGLMPGIEIDEFPEPLGQPGQAHLVVSALLLECLYATIGEVHLPSVLIVGAP